MEKLNDENCYSWKQNIQLILSYCDLDMLFEADSTPPSNVEACKEWYKNDRKSQAVIVL